MFKHKHNFVPLYRVKVDKPKTQINGMFKVTIDHFCFRTKEEEERKKRKDSWSCSSHNKKAKGLDSAFKRQAHHALDGNRSWFGHLA